MEKVTGFLVEKALERFIAKPSWARQMQFETALGLREVSIKLKMRF